MSPPVCRGAGRYHGHVTKLTADLEPRATAQQIRAAKARLSKLARSLELSDLRLTPQGTLVVHVERDPSYRPVLKFVTEATRILGAEPHVVTDDAPAASRLQASPL